MNNIIQGISLDGGGYKTIMYIGGLFYLNKYSKNFKIKNLKMIHGSSAGSIIATCLALGLTPEKMLKESLAIDFKSLIFEEFNNEISLQQYFLLDKPFEGMTQGNKFIKHINSIFSNNCSFWEEGMTFLTLFKKTKIKLIITATNITKRESKDFQYNSDPNLPILLAIRMSCGIPFIFNPFIFDNDEFVDGDLYEKTFQTISNFLPNKDIIRFCCEKKNEKRSRGIFSLISSVVMSHKPRLKEDKNKFIKKYNFYSEQFFLKFNCKSITSLYTEGIIQTQQQQQQQQPCRPPPLSNCMILVKPKNL